MAEKYNIDICIEVKSNLDKIPIEPWEFCKVLSNIIDNSVQALISKEKNRKLNIDISEDKKEYYISIFNNGPKISKENLNNIFEEGFTTKKENGHGVGLFIVKNIIKEAKGDIY
ncbi:sensor histidine kinase, partial [Clostridium tarantellae]